MSYKEYDSFSFSRNLIGADGKLTRLHKGGGAPAAPPPPAPPPTERRVEVQTAKRQARVDSAKRKGQRATLLAGETGGFKEEETKRTLLGGR